MNLNIYIYVEIYVVYDFNYILERVKWFYFGGSLRVGVSMWIIGYFEVENILKVFCLKLWLWKYDDSYLLKLL